LESPTTLPSSGALNQFELLNLFFVCQKTKSVESELQKQPRRKGLPKTSWRDVVLGDCYNNDAECPACGMSADGAA
jgi:hypothetical protein